MAVINRVIDLFAALQPEELDTLAPATRQRFAQICYHWGRLADQPLNAMDAVLHAEGMATSKAQTAKTESVLARLQRGDRSP